MTNQRGKPSAACRRAAAGWTCTPSGHAPSTRSRQRLTRATLDVIRARYLGRGDGLLTVVRKGIGTIADAEARRALGQTVNAVVERVTEAIEERRAVLTDGRRRRPATPST